MRNYLIGAILSFLAVNCNNIGFVEKARAAANNEFGIEVYTLAGSSIADSALTSGNVNFGTSCTGISGISKANCLCQAEAPSRGLAGTYRAWVSSSLGIDAICNIQGLENNSCSVASGLGPFIFKSSAGYILLAQDFAELSSTGFRVALSSVSKPIWTGTKSDGRASGNDCGAFTNTSGSPTTGDEAASGTGFTTGRSENCTGVSGTFLCMRQAK